VDFEELYQDIILDHSQNPRNYGESPEAEVHVHGNNPTCGDEITVHLSVDPEDMLRVVSFTGNGCSICMASASMMTQKVKGKPSRDASALNDRFHEMITAETETAPDRSLGDLRALQGVRKFPLRVKCATLAWNALKQAIEAARGGPKERSFSVEPESSHEAEGIDLE
jgi:nitrogen fixation NifU-like protein